MDARAGESMYLYEKVTSRVLIIPLLILYGIRRTSCLTFTVLYNGMDCFLAEDVWLLESGEVHRNDPLS